MTHCFSLRFHPCIWLSNITDTIHDIRRGFGRSGPNKGPNQPKQGNMGPSGYVQTGLSPSQTNLAPSPTPSPSAIIENPLNQELNLNRRPPFFFREQYANLIVKGNFMTLAAKPVLIEEGEWLAHQGKPVVIMLRCHCRLLEGAPSCARESKQCQHDRRPEITSRCLRRYLTAVSRGAESPAGRHAQDHPRARQEHWSTHLQHPVLSSHERRTVSNISPTLTPS